MRRLRGTAFDPFGRTEVGGTERALVAEYRDVITRLADGLNRDNHALAVEIAALPDMVRGYEEIKLRNAAALPRADGGTARRVHRRRAQRDRLAADRRAKIEGMRVMRFGARVAAGPRGSGIIAVPFDPDETWGAKAAHHVNGTVSGCRVRVTIAPGEGGWAFPLSPSRMRDQGFEVGAEVACELAPEGPQRGDLADDIAAALEANPAAGAFFDTLAQFYRKAYLRYIDATTRRPDVRAARIAEVTDLCASGVKERP